MRILVNLMNQIYDSIFSSVGQIFLLDNFDFDQKTRRRKLLLYSSKDHLKISNVASLVAKLFLARRCLLHSGQYNFQLTQRKDDNSLPKRYKNIRTKVLHHFREPKRPSKLQILFCRLGSAWKLLMLMLLFTT